MRAELPEGQDSLWYYTNVDKNRINSAPVLEGFKKRGWEVMLMDEPVDEWVVMAINEFDGVELKSVNKGEIPEEESEEEDPISQAAKDQARPLVGWMGSLLENDVAEVRMSSRLTDSPSVLVDQEGRHGCQLGTDSSRCKPNHAFPETGVRNQSRAPHGKNAGQTQQ